MLAKDIMIRDVVSIDRESMIWQAALWLVESRIGGLPVVDRDKKFIGFISEKQMLSILPKSPSDSKVGDYLTDDRVSADENQDVQEIHNLLVAKGMRRIPITNAQGQLVGIISRRDLLARLLQERGLIHLKEEH